ncbi:MAG: mechanosensitive ion channel family protein [Anaerolineae bacterium]|nr:mechanosensitive ion channel family protein [Anaerolineae bacterium]
MNIDSFGLGNLGNLRDSALQMLLYFGARILGAILLWLIGRWVIRLIVRISRRGLRVRHLDTTMVAYIASSIEVILTLLLMVAILGLFGIETTSFAALFAAAGVAIGVAWAGLLSHFAAGVFLLLIRPFKLGDSVTIGGYTGTVKEIGFFGTTIATADNVLTIVPNNKVFGETIQNYNTMPYRRVDVQVKIGYKHDPLMTCSQLKTRISHIANVLSLPEIMVDIVKLEETGMILAARPSCRPEHYEQVMLDTNRVVRLALFEMGVLV